MVVNGRVLIIYPFLISAIGAIDEGLWLLVTTLQ